MKNKYGKQELEKRINDWKVQGKKESEITWGMLNDGFQSLSGIPDDFCSAEDPADRIELWGKYKQSLPKRCHYDCGGVCYLCRQNNTNETYADSDDRLYKD